MIRASPAFSFFAETALCHNRFIDLSRISYWTAIHAGIMSLKSAPQPPASFQHLPGSSLLAMSPHRCADFCLEQGVVCLGDCQSTIGFWSHEPAKTSWRIGHFQASHFWNHIPKVTAPEIYGKILPNLLVPATRVDYKSHRMLLGLSCRPALPAARCLVGASRLPRSFSLAPAAAPPPSHNALPAAVAIRIVICCAAAGGC